MPYLFPCYFVPFCVNNDLLVWVFGRVFGCSGCDSAMQVAARLHSARLHVWLLFETASSVYLHAVCVNLVERLWLVRMRSHFRVSQLFWAVVLVMLFEQLPIEQLPIEKV